VRWLGRGLLKTIGLSAGCAAVGAVLLGVRVDRALGYYGSGVFARRITVWIRWDWMCVGVLAGGVVGAVVARRVCKRSEIRAPARLLAQGRRDRRKTVRILVGFLLLAACLGLGFAWLASALSCVFSQVELTNAMGPSAIPGIILSWVLVGRRLQGSKRLEHALLLGPFKYWCPSWLSIPQMKVLWVSLVLVALLLIFPPHVAFTSGVDGVGSGGRTFVGFHFIMSDERQVLGDSSSLSWPEIDWTWTVVLALAVVIGCSVVLVLLRARPKDDSVVTKRKHMEHPR